MATSDLAPSSSVTDPSDADVLDVIDVDERIAADAETDNETGDETAGEVTLEQASAAWAEAGREVLLGVAGTYHAVISHARLASEVQRVTRIHTRRQTATWLGDVLGRIAEESERRDEPNLASLCVDSRGSAGKTYGDGLVRRGGRRPRDLEAHASEARLACYRAAGALDLPDDGGEAALPPALTASRERAVSRERKRAMEARPIDLCPACFIALPVSGVCDNCA